MKVRSHFGSRLQGALAQSYSLAARRRQAAMSGLPSDLATVTMMLMLMTLLPSLLCPSRHSPHLMMLARPHLLTMLCTIRHSPHLIMLVRPHLLTMLCPIRHSPHLMMLARPHLLTFGVSVTMAGRSQCTVVQPVQHRVMQTSQNRVMQFFFHW